MPILPHYFSKKTLLRIISSIITVVVFSDICVFYFSILMSVDPQKYSLLWYTSIHGVACNPILHSQHLNLVLLSFFVAEHTGHQIFLRCRSQCLLFLVSSLSSWLMDGACLLCLAVKMPNGEGSLLFWGGCVCCNPIWPLVNLWTTGTSGWQFVLSVSL